MSSKTAFGLIKNRFDGKEELPLAEVRFEQCR